VNVLVCDLLQPSLVTLPSLCVTVVVPQASVAEAEPSARPISLADGLHPSDVAVPLAVIVGGVVSAVQLTVREAVAVLPQPSLAVNVLVCDLLQPSLVTLPSLCVTVVVPQASVAEAEPSARPISLADGLHPSDVAVPLAVIVGGVVSAVQLTVREVVAVLPQPSLAVNVLVCERAHPLLVTLPSLCVTVVVPQASVAEAEPSARPISLADGLHPSDVAVPLAVIVGGVVSAVQVTVREAVAVLPQPSLAVNVLVCDLLQPSLVTLPSLWVTVVVPQASVAEAEPSARPISLADGLHPSDVAVPLAVIVGGVVSAVQLTVREVVA